MFFQQEGIQKFKLRIFSSFNAVFVDGLTKLGEFTNLLVDVIFFDQKESLHGGAV